MTAKFRLMGVNHVALEVADLEEALAFYGGADDEQAGDLRTTPEALEELRENGLG